MSDLPLVTVYVGLGSNLGDTEENLNEALARLETYGEDIQLKKMSHVYTTEPQELKDQPWFANQVIELEIDPVIWSPEGVLSMLQAIEGQLGRNAPDSEPVERYGPRILDMDILLWGDYSQNSEYLTIPHPKIRERAFVLVPLQEIAPDLVFSDGTTIREALGAIEYTLDDKTIKQD